MDWNLGRCIISCRKKCNMSPCLFVLQLMLIIGLAHALVVFRVVAAPLMSEGKWEFIKDHANTVAVMLGAVLHYITIQIMTRVCIPVSWLSCCIHSMATNCEEQQQKKQPFFKLGCFFYTVSWYKSEIQGDSSLYNTMQMSMLHTNSTYTSYIGQELSHLSCRMVKRCPGWWYSVTCS